MKLQHDIKLFDNSEPISAIYVKEKFERADTAISIYDKYKISILLSDGLSVVTNNKVIPTYKGSILFFRPDELHFGRFFQTSVYSYLDFFIPLTFFDNFATSKNITYFFNDTSENRINCINFKNEHKKEVYNIAVNIIDILKTNTSENDIRLFSNFLQIVLKCNDFYQSEKTSASSAPIPTIVHQTMQCISENFCESLSLENLATQANCSVAYLSRTFKKHTQMTVYEYITNTRIANAQNLLNEGLSVTEVCFSCGFNDCSNFINKFKKITGTTPLKFQQQNTKNV